MILVLPKVLLHKNQLTQPEDLVSSSLQEGIHHISSFDTSVMNKVILSQSLSYFLPKTETFQHFKYAKRGQICLKSCTFHYQSTNNIPQNIQYFYSLDDIICLNVSSDTLDYLVERSQMDHFSLFVIYALTSDMFVF
jgi:hypothetical protein